MRHQRKTTAKSTYTLASNIKFMLGMIRSSDKFLALSVIFTTPLTLFGMVVAAYMPSVIIDAIGATAAVDATAAVGGNATAVVSGLTDAINSGANVGVTDVTAATATATAATLLLIIAGIFAVRALAKALEIMVAGRREYSGSLLQLQISTIRTKKCLDLDFEQLIDPDVMLKSAKAEAIAADGSSDSLLLLSVAGDFI